MTEHEWYDALADAGSSELGELFAGGVAEPDREAEAEREPIDLVDAFPSGSGTAALRLVAARLLVESGGVSDEPTVVIHGRNERCLEVLQAELAAGKQRLGVFYGADHMEHLEHRLVEDLGWRLVEEEWVQAWDCTYARFPKEEKGLHRKRYRARRDLGQLIGAVGQFARHHQVPPTWARLRAASDDGKLPGRDDGRDPWGREYVLRFVDGRYQVLCLGSDGEADTDDDLVEVEPSTGGLFGGLVDRARRSRNEAVQELERAKKERDKVLEEIEALEKRRRGGGR